MTQPALFISKSQLRRRARKTKPPVQFTQTELQKLSSHIRMSIRAFDTISQKYAAIAKRAWDASDKTRKDDPEVQEAFAIFSVAHAKNQKIRAKMQSLAGLQRKVKQMMKS
jgi:DNA repair ATPase RecN